MTTTTVKTIGTTGDYTTLQSWEDAAPANLVTADEIWQGQLQNQTFTVAATALTLSGSTSDATRYKELRCVSGASFRDNASVQSNALRYNASNGAAISCTSGNYTYAIVISEQYVRLNGLQVTHSSTGGSASTVRVTVANSLIENCIIETAGSTAGAINYVNCSSLTLKNSLLVQRGASKSCIVGASGSQGTFYNVTMAVPSDKTAASNLFVTSPYTNITLNACAFFGVSALKASGTVTVNNGFSNLSGTGITTATYNTSQFENITDATRDYRLPSGSAMIATYTADTTNSPVDIAGTTRNTGSTQADVGCWEYATAGSSTDLTIQDATHGHAADGLTITVASTLAIADATHAHTADNLTLSVSGATDLTIQDATHGHSADSLTLTLGYVDLTIADALHAHTADNITLGGLYTDLELILKILSNRQELNAGTGTFTVYDDDSVSVLFTASAWADAAGTVPYSGGTLGRIDALA